MPVCPACDNRPFVNKEALLQHLKSSSAPHPICTLCDRRFVSETAYNAHMADKHPPTYDCTLCNRPFHAPFALEDHYRGSAVHPNCVRCGRGFKDDAACEEHYRSAHPKIPCIQCGGALFYEDAMDLHYQESDNHPSCNICQKGFKDSISYSEHFSASHEELRCAVCSENFETEEGIQNHFWTSQNHPKCLICALGFRDSTSELSHQEDVHTPQPNANGTIAYMESQPAAEDVLPPPSNVPEQPETSIPTYSMPASASTSPSHRMQSLIIGERRTDSPDLRLKMDFASPLTEVKPPLFSPTGLPRPADNIERFWSSRENIQVGSPRAQNGAESTALTRTHFYHNTDPGPSRNSLVTFDPVQPQHRYREGRNYTPLQLPPPQIVPPRPDIRSRLYQGSVRHALKSASLSRPAPPTELQLGGDQRTYYSDTQSHRSFGSASTSVRPSFRQDRGSASSDNFVNWKELLGEGIRPFGSGTPRASLFAETLPYNADISQTLSPSHLSVQGQNLMPSPSLATISSPASSAAGHSFGFGHNEPDTRPTTASSARLPALPQLTYTLSPSSPRSPEVRSPPGLGLLPAISPLATTPIDLITFDIPEAHKPLPESPVETAATSPVTVVQDLSPQEPEPQVEEIHVPVAPSPLSSPSAKSYITSPQEPLDRIDRVASVGTQTAELSPLTPAVTTPPEPPREENKNPLHCRVCLADTCDDITASMCGHIFCNRCIVDAVIKTNRCPVCMTPTLLYCLFRLDLAA
ncbi:hypothetical protein CVT26_010848 [Gymnopilus dilepis]|uniref:RING-type domain-containing protein n=1 Tax=Gymnopilus dilepis TaxID=231916 RepID=A0A409W5E7_9AGAR|nr:hypothetical protein CVT26_010848 [Gymnopilus dilepis]